MKVRIELTDGSSEDEIVIRCRAVDSETQRLVEQLLSSSQSRLAFYRGETEVFLSLNDVLFFETQDEHVYAHTADETYRCKLRLSVLMDKLPRTFIRASKSAIVNTARVYAVTRNLAASSLVEFERTHKRVYVSRLYYSEFKNRLNERIDKRYED